MSVGERIDCSACVCEIGVKVETLIVARQTRGCRRRRTVYVTDSDGYTFTTRRGCCEGTIFVEYEPAKGKTCRYKKKDFY